MPHGFCGERIKSRCLDGIQGRPCKRKILLTKFLSWIVLYYFDFHSKQYHLVQVHYTQCPMAKAFKKWCEFLWVMVFRQPTTTMRNPQSIFLFLTTLGHVCWTTLICNYVNTQCITTMNGANRSLVTYEPIEFEKQPIDIQDYRKKLPKLF